MNEATTNDAKDGARVIQKIYFCAAEGLSLSARECELLSRILSTKDPLREAAFDAWESIYVPET